MNMHRSLCRERALKPVPETLVGANAVQPRCLAIICLAFLLRASPCSCTATILVSYFVQPMREMETTLGVVCLCVWTMWVIQHKSP